MAFLAPLAAVAEEGIAAGAAEGAAAGAGAAGAGAAGMGIARAGLAARWGARAMLLRHRQNNQPQRQAPPTPPPNAMGNFETVMQPHQF